MLRKVRVSKVVSMFLFGLCVSATATAQFLEYKEPNPRDFVNDDDDEINDGSFTSPGKAYGPMSDALGVKPRTKEQQDAKKAYENSTWVGSTLQELTAQFGQPTNISADKNGGKIYHYSYESHYQTITSFCGSYSCSGYVNNHVLIRDRYFKIDAKGIVRKWKFIDEHGKNLCTSSSGFCGDYYN